MSDSFGATLQDLKDTKVYLQTILKVREDGYYDAIALGMAECDCAEERSFEMLRFAIGCVEKQIQKKPLNTTGYYRNNRCPACNARIKSGCGSSSFYKNNWCNHCGQKIDWEVQHE